MLLNIYLFKIEKIDKIIVCNTYKEKIIGN